MADSVACIKERHPEIYKNMKYKIVEISAALAKAQKARAEREGLGDVVEVINEDFFKWSGVQDTGEGSYVVALEVFVSATSSLGEYERTRTEAPLGQSSTRHDTIRYQDPHTIPGGSFYRLQRRLCHAL